MMCFPAKHAFYPEKSSETLPIIATCLLLNLFIPTVTVEWLALLLTVRIIQPGHRFYPKLYILQI